jgi:nucleoside-diphosphate-sugar epimerase
LLKDNNVTVIDNYSTGRRSNIEGLDVKFVEGSITDLPTLKELCRGKDYLFHLAAIPSVPRSIKEPKLSNDINITGTLNMLMAARDSEVKKVVYASSSSVYGDTPTLPKVESMPPNPQSPYAVTKLAGEYYCRVFDKVYEMPTTSLRFFNVFGPKQDPKSEYAAVIPKFIQRLKEDKPPIIYGDGEQTRDFTFVKDVVSAIILAGLSEKANGEVLNVAGGQRISINELASKLATLMGKDIGPEYTEERPGDVKHSLADIGKAESLTGFSPKYSLDDGLMKTIDYLRIK